MHDFHLADTIFKAILEYGEKNNLKRITKANIDLGSIVEHGEEVLPDNLKFNMEMMAKGTMAEGLGIIINKIDRNEWVLKEIDGE